jgi:hypothetical protein
LNFNPWSLWGLRRLASVPVRHAASPWNLEFINYIRFSDWLSLLGMEIERTAVMMFSLPMNSQTLNRKSATVERYGRRFWPVFGGVYMVQSIKRVSPLTPSQPFLQRLRQMGSGVLEPTTRTGH